MASFNNLRTFLRSVGLSDMDLNAVPDTIELNQLADTITGAPMVDYMRANHARIFKLFGAKIASKMIDTSDAFTIYKKDVRGWEQANKVPFQKATPFKAGDIESASINSSWIIAGNFFRNTSGRTGTLFLHLNRKRIYHWYAYPYVPEMLWQLLKTQPKAGTLFWSLYLRPNGYQPWGGKVSNSSAIKQAVGKTGQNRGKMSANQRQKLSKATRWTSAQSKNSGRIAIKSKAKWAKVHKGD